MSFKAKKIRFVVCFFGIDINLSCYCFQQRLRQ